MLPLPALNAIPPTDLDNITQNKLNFWPFSNIDCEKNVVREPFPKGYVLASDGQLLKPKT